MTGCPDDPILIRRIAGELPPSAAADLDAHVGTCESCRVRLAQMKSTWDMLGELQVKPPEQDLTARIMSATRHSKAPRWVVIGRLAAAIALAVGLGVTAGRLTPVRTPPTPLGTISSEELLARTGLDEPIIAQIVEQAPEKDGLPQEEAL